MNAQKTVKKYNATQAQLYAIATLGWSSFQLHLVNFSSFKLFYTPSYHADRLAELQAAKALPDVQQRDEPVETALGKLKAKATVCRTKWQDLKSYIETAYSGIERKAKLEAAGSNYYSNSGNSNWEVLLQMMNTAMLFINEHAIALQQDDNMPATFPGQFAQDLTDVEGLYLDFKNKEQAFKQQTKAKIEANNLVYNNLISMMKDGQKIFRFDAATRARFVFKKVKSLVNLPSSTVKVFEGIAPQMQAVNIELTDVNLATAGKKLSFFNTSEPASGTPPPISIYFAENATDLPSGSGNLTFYLNAGESALNLTPSLAGYTPQKPFLMVYNATGINGTYKVEVKK